MPIPAPPHVQSLLDRLHAKSTEQEEIYAKEGKGDLSFDDYMRDKFIALEADKCEYLYTLIRALDAKLVVEVCRTIIVVGRRLMCRLERALV